MHTLFLCAIANEMSKLAMKKYCKNIDYTLVKWYKYVEKRGMIVDMEELNKLKQKLDKEIEQECSYEQILKTSEDIDALLTKYYLEKLDNII